MDDKTKHKIQSRAPFNISLLNLNLNQTYKLLGKVTSTSMFDGANFNIHPEGLWSNEIFGATGSPERMKKFAYMDLNTTVLHPLVYREMISSVGMLDEIMSGQTFAKWDDINKTFVKSNALEGETGFDFFMRHFDQLKLEDTGSPKRREAISLMEKNRELCQIDKLVILPAGYRDIEFKNGQVSHDEVNQIYREILSLANSISSGGHRSNASLINSTRYAVQAALLKLYMYLGEIVGHGKSKLIQGKWASRTVFNGTRNTITAVSPSGRFVGDERNINFNETTVGMFQQMVANLPFSVRGIKESFLKDVFHNPLEPVMLVNKKTLKSEPVQVASEWFDLFQSDEGIKKLIQRYRPIAGRNRIVEVEGRYLALLYKGPNEELKILHSIDELPSDRSKEDVHPMTFTELMFICTSALIDGRPGISTRYPITGIGSNIPARTKMMATARSERRVMLNDNWEKDEQSHVFHRYPINGEDTWSSMCPPLEALGSQGGDEV